MSTSIFCLFLSIFEIYITVFCLNSQNIKLLIINLGFLKKMKGILILEKIQKKILFLNGNENEVLKQRWV